MVIYPVDYMHKTTYSPSFASFKNSYDMVSSDSTIYPGRKIDLRSVEQ